MVTKWCFFFKFIYFERERERESEHKWRRGRERERILSRLCTVNAEPDMGPEPMTCEIMT